MLFDHFCLCHSAMLKTYSLLFTSTTGFPVFLYFFKQKAQVFICEVFWSFSTCNEISWSPPNILSSLWHLCLITGHVSVFKKEPMIVQPGNGQLSMDGKLWAPYCNIKYFMYRAFPYYLAPLGHCKNVWATNNTYLKQPKIQIPSKFSNLGHCQMSQFKTKDTLIWKKNKTARIWWACDTIIVLRGIFWNLASPQRWKPAWKCSSFKLMKIWDCLKRNW